MRIRVAVWLSAVMLVMAVPAAAQHFPPDDALRALISTRIDQGFGVGMVLGVLEADGSTRVVSAGRAGPGARPLGEQSLFEIGSITKVFTAILLADMVRRGELDLSDRVAHHLPAHVRVPSRGGREITLLDLATHHSGLPRLPDNMRPADPTNPYADYTVEQLYAFLASYELRRDIGADYEYSNLAVGLLGHVLASVAGKSYEDLVRARILQPLGMDATGISLDPRMQEWMTKGHNRSGTVVPLWDLPTLAGAGALRSSARDMLRFLAANARPAEADIAHAMRLSHQERRSMSEQSAVGLLWAIRKTSGSTIVWHNGGTAGFRTFIGFDPDRGVGVVLLTNSAYGADDIGFHLINPAIALSPPNAAGGS